MPDLAPPNSILKFAAAAALATLLCGCASEPPRSQLRTSAPVKPNPPSQSVKVQPDLRPYASIGSYRAAAISGDYAAYPALAQFIEQMVQKHGFDREYLNGLFSQAKRKQWTLDYLAKSDQGLKGKPSKGGWTRYRSQFLDARHIDAGVAFWRAHQNALQRASRQYGVPAEYILGILAVETTFGGFVGNHRVIDALTTLGFDYQRRGEFFRSELESFLVMTRGEGIDPAKPVGSFAGAMGLGQFMPSSFLQWAVDFNGDGRRDLWNPQDAIGSVANYFAQHGWRSEQPVVSNTRGSYSGIDSLEPGIDREYPLGTLLQAGIEPAGNCGCDYPLRLLLLRHQNSDEYLLGHPNFYVITRYNHSTHYAMAVHELAQAIRRGYQQLAG
ncbi:lytic murein transglycosylase B [Methylomonas sp. EFPC3]|uniref:lytic murein transglycosylase B n=1 Tax=Methylomonas sp. EFPC3 TaxID=3021710 RepID=UPI002417D40A|nr:lytic murein transglycosylase B [Methylomonas sp. EFPC3]WFP49588.1 lytic murein transglycosylase B [Methylomonas sp. EFPC3]